MRWVQEKDLTCLDNVVLHWLHEESSLKAPRLNEGAEKINLLLSMFTVLVYVLLSPHGQNHLVEHKHPF